MSEETTKNSADEISAVEPTAAPAPVTPAAPDAAAAEVTPKKEVKRDIFAEIGLGGDEEVKVHKAKGSKNVHRGIVHVTATFNNTLVSVTDVNDNSIG